MKKKKDEVADLRARYNWIRDITDDAIAKRSSVAEFHGLEQELREMQIAIIESYKRTKPISHPRDKGDQREEILRHFLLKHGLIPEKYGVSAGSTRVVAPSGHMSPELDVLLYNRSEAVVLKRFEGTLDYFPIESVHGTIQVKSKLTKTSLREGLDNIRAFKSLKPSINLEQNVGGLTFASGLYRRFGILFAYEYELEWKTVCDEIRKYMKTCPVELLPNAIFILDAGHFFIGTEDKYCVHQKDFIGVDNPIIHGFPDHSGSCLLQFYTVLMELMRKSVAGSPNIDSYIRLPLTAGEYSYSYSFGAFSEIGKCSTHGTFLKRLTEKKIEKIVEFARTCEAVNWIQAIEIAQGKKGDDEETYKKQPGTVRIYNPEKMSLSDLLMDQNGSLTYESIDIEDMRVWLPWYYVEKESLIDDCPKCARLVTRRSKRSPVTS